MAHDRWRILKIPLSLRLNSLPFQKVKKKYDVSGMVGIAVFLKIILKLSLG